MVRLMQKLFCSFLWFDSGDKDPAHHSNINVDQSGTDHTSLSLGPGQSPSGLMSDTSVTAAQGGWYEKYFYSENLGQHEKLYS